MNKTAISKKPSGQKSSIPPIPQPPSPHPEKLPSKVPIPGEPTPSGSGIFQCKICGKKFNSKDELELHIKTDHELMRK
jgi:hypothetical protein